MARRNDVLELAVLGLLQDAPMHGYEVRKTLTGLIGRGRAFSYGSLYPCLRDLTARGLIAKAPGVAGSGRRSRIVYEITADGKEHLADLLNDAGPAAWEDDQFGIHFAFFGSTDAAARLRILQGRRSRLQERLETFRTSVGRTRRRLDTYTLELQRHGLESIEREVSWLDDLITSELNRDAPAQPDAADPGGARTHPSDAGAPGGGDTAAAGQSGPQAATNDR
jgi:DNA-binding PadR family transcriptional regulator